MCTVLIKMHHFSSAACYIIILSPTIWQVLNSQMCSVQRQGKKRGGKKHRKQFAQDNYSSDSDGIAEDYLEAIQQGKMGSSDQSEVCLPDKEHDVHSKESTMLSRASYQALHVSDCNEFCAIQADNCFDSRFARLWLEIVQIRGWNLLKMPQLHYKDIYTFAGGRDFKDAYKLVGASWQWRP